MFSGIVEEAAQVVASNPIKETSSDDEVLIRE